MGLIRDSVFVCFDCETTGLDPDKDRIVEIAAAKFTFDKILDAKEDLVDPGISIPQSTTDIHHITDGMVRGKPKIGERLSAYLEMIGEHIVVGHAISFDIALLRVAAQKCGMPHRLDRQICFDTLRMARLYGESPNNALETLREHFHVKARGAHRAMDDVRTNIEVFKHLCYPFKTTEQIAQRLKRPILLKSMPFGRYKGRAFREIPIEYLKWAAGKKFDEDLLFSLRIELKKRKQGNLFSQVTNPFSAL